MLKTVIISTNDKEEYLKYLPHVIEAWNKLGWNTLTFHRGKYNLHNLNDDKNRIVTINDASEYREETIVQVSRLLAALYIEDGMIMTSDVDMMPCKDYWHPESGKITCYGYDLTGYSQYPICYIAMEAYRWREIMEIQLGGNFIDTFNSLMEKYPNAKEEDFYKWWVVDQDIITEKLLKENVVSIERGNSIYVDYIAANRHDRFKWQESLSADAIDAHMPRPYSIEAVNFIKNKYFNG